MQVITIYCDLFKINYLLEKVLKLANLHYLKLPCANTDDVNMMIMLRLLPDMQHFTTYFGINWCITFLMQCAKPCVKALIFTFTISSLRSFVKVRVVVSMKSFLCPFFFRNVNYPQHHPFLMLSAPLEKPACTVFK